MASIALKDLKKTSKKTAAVSRGGVQSQQHLTS